MKTFCIEIAGLVIKFIENNNKTGLLKNVERRYTNFFPKNSSSKTILHIEVQKNSIPQNTNDVHITKEKDFYRINYSTLNAVVDIKSKYGYLNMEDGNEYVFDSALRIIYSLILAKEGFLVHAGGICLKNNAYIFTGPSESGKSTIVKLATEKTPMQILSDEIIAFRKLKNKWTVFSTPFSGTLEKIPNNISSKIKKIFFIKKNTKTTCKPLTKKESLACLLPNVIFFSKDNGLVENIFDLSCNFVKETPCFELNFSRDVSFFRYLN